jgi:hydroxymethylpyrimidine/phosphomethylpyrimidine kinase
MEYTRPIVISIAGFDPTGGAGVLADIKTIEQNNCLGFGVLTSTTIQTEIEVMGVNWLTEDEILNQLNPLLENYEVRAVKIGIVNQLSTLKAICLRIREVNPEINIVWDPVLVATSGKPFLEDVTKDDLDDVLSLIDLITPNTLEAIELGGGEDEMESARELLKMTNVLLKGGHSSIEVGTDVLLYEDKEIKIKSEVVEYHDKHGTGCILASAIASDLAKGTSLVQSCRNAKQYLETTANSNSQRLAYHVQ